MVYAVKRILAIIPVLLGSVLVVFGLFTVIPGDPAALLLGEQATPEAVAELHRSMGLDRAFAARLGAFVVRLARFDLGYSLFRNEPVARSIATRLPATLELALAALILAFGLGVGLGVVAAVRERTVIDLGVLLFSQLGVSIPVFWLGILLMFWLAVEWNWFPAVGRGAPLIGALGEALTGRPTALFDSVKHLALPALTLGLTHAAVVSRLVRAAMLEALSEPFVHSALARGLPRRTVLVGHVLRRALVPVAGLMGVRFGVLLGGAVLTESVFGWPGLGQLAVSAISQRDLPLVQGVVLVFAFLFSVLNLAVDLVQGVLDPRIRVGVPYA